MPVEPLVIELPHFLYTFHKPRELFELGPLIVDCGKRTLHFDRFLYSFHGSPPAIDKSVDFDVFSSSTRETQPSTLQTNANH
jgi:hypothetical protein